MTSLTDDAYVGTLHYKALDPPIIGITLGLQEVCDEDNNTTTSINCSSLNATSGNITASLGNVVASNGDLIATSGGAIVVNNIVSTGGNITATAGDITATAGDITATAGGVIVGGNSQLNRMSFNTFYGGTTFATPVSLANVLPYVAFTVPANTYNTVLFFNNALAGSATFPFELHTSIPNLLRDYNILVSNHTADNGGGQSLGYDNIVVGDSISTPADKTKITIVINTAIGWTAQTLKCMVQFVYTPSP